MLVGTVGKNRTYFFFFWTARGALYLTVVIIFALSEHYFLRFSCSTILSIFLCFSYAFGLSYCCSVTASSVVIQTCIWDFGITDLPKFPKFSRWF